MTELTKFLLRNAVIGFLIGDALVCFLIWKDVGGLGAALEGSPNAMLAAGLLFFYVGSTFAPAQTAIAIGLRAYLKNRDDDDEAPRWRVRLERAFALEPALAPVRPSSKP